MKNLNRYLLPLSVRTDLALRAVRNKLKEQRGDL